jgi:uridine kinase
VSGPTPTAVEVLALASSRPPTLGAGRLVCVDGPAGSGKTTLADQLGAPVVHVDDLLEGWSGLATLHRQVLPLLDGLAAGKRGRYQRYDWLAGRRAEVVEVPPAPLLVLEGVGSGSPAWAHLATVLVFVEAGPELRLARGMARDGEQMRGHWLTWMDDEAALLAREDTRARADIVVRTD